MRIEELETGGDVAEEEGKGCVVVTEGGRVVGVWNAKRVLVGAGARALFYPTLLYNVVRNKFQAEFRWWDRVSEFLLLGAVPFPTDVPHLKALGVKGVITLNEPYETLVPTCLYHAYGIDHLVIPTRDYCFAPSLSSICRAVEFIHENALLGQTVYVHCKAGRGRSTTIVLCYLVQHQQMTPESAYAYVKSIRPRVLLASAQWMAVQDYYNMKVKVNHPGGNGTDLVLRSLAPPSARNVVQFDDGSAVVVTEADLDGYDPALVSSAVRNQIWTDISVVYRVRVAGQAALTGISCLWLRCRADQKVLEGKLVSKSTCSASAGRMGAITVDIHVY